jgi:FAD/FMN-containing dehydrogenase
MTTNLTSQPAHELGDLLDGPVLADADPRVAAELAPFNCTFTPSPAVTVGATSAREVAAAVRWAGDHGHPVAVVATGHGLHSDLSGAVAISTRRMRDVTIDPHARTARVGAGARWAQVIEAAAPHGLAPLNGSSSSVGVVGYTLGGGVGPMGRRFGFAADHVRRVQLVTADGAIREVDAASDPELFWAIRGGKGNFGIVTELEFDLMPVTTLYAGGIFFPASACADVLHTYRRWVQTLPDDATNSVALLRLPPDPALPEPLRGQFAVHLRFAHLDGGSGSEGEKLLAPMRAVAAPLMDLVGEMPYASVDSIHMDPTEPLPVWERGAGLRELPAAAVDVDVPLIMVELRQLGGALARPAAVPNAVAGRDAAFSLFAIGPMAGSLTEVVPAVTQSVADALAPWASRGGLLNFQGVADPARVASLWSDTDRARLLAVKRRVDPAGVFSTGQAFC